MQSASRTRPITKRRSRTRWEPPAVPDLVVASIDNTPQNPTIKDEITFEVEVCNEGTGGARSSQVEFKIGEEESPPKLSLPSIPAGQCSVAERTEQLTGPGEYQTVATTDIDDQVNETDETKNVREGTVTVEVGELVVTHNQIDRFDFPEVTNFVSVTITLGDPVENLGPSNFDIEENSTPQSGLLVENVGESGPSLSVSLVVDRSAAWRAPVSRKQRPPRSPLLKISGRATRPL